MNDKLDTLLHMAMGAAIFSLLGFYVPKIYFTYFDNQVYYKINNPITVEQKTNIQCSYIDAYIHREALIDIKGSSTKQLTLIRVDKAGLRERIASYYTDIQAEAGESTVIAHWKLPCDIPNGTYIFEGVAEYMVRDIRKTTRFYTERFEVVASSSAQTNNAK